MIILLDGMLTGLFLQLAIGPVFFYLLSITMDSDFINSLSGILAVTLVDYSYIILSLIGIGKLLQKNKIKKKFGITSSIILVLFGLMILHKGIAGISESTAHVVSAWTPLASFTSCFILTISSPLTIVFWSSIFSAKAIEKNYQKAQLVIFGMGTGLSTFVFLSVCMWILSMVKSGIPAWIVQILNCMVGGVLILYGIIRAIKTLKNG
jgi:threonine/homoserine/homoserine lactone efflux protein